jgi:hypothetical protein
VSEREPGPNPEAGSDEEAGPDEEPRPPYVPLAADATPVADTPMWLSHHWPDAYDRCAVVGRRHVCRRCLFMYPIAAVAAVVASVGPWWPRDLDPVLIPLLPFPAVVEFVLDNLGIVRYSRVRQAVLTSIGALAAGAGYVRYLDRPGDPVVWGTVVVYGLTCAVSAFVGHRRGAGEMG